MKNRKKRRSSNARCSRRGEDWLQLGSKSELVLGEKLSVTRRLKRGSQQQRQRRRYRPVGTV